MVSIEELRELLGETLLTDQEVAAIRDEMKALADIIFEQMIYERAKAKQG